MPGRSREEEGRLSRWTGRHTSIFYTSAGGEQMNHMCCLLLDAHLPSYIYDSSTNLMDPLVVSVTGCFALCWRDFD
jgi:hypothetical protein